jgi:putative Holliday junction resolvase
MKQGKALGIDFGEKRTGLAITDALRMIASPLETVETRTLKERVTHLIAIEKITTLVLGETIHADGSLSAIGEKQKTFQDWIEKQFPSLEVVRIDERNSSKEAQQALIFGGMKKMQRQKKENLDKVSAAIILQRFLDSNNQKFF